ncbi:MAG TPA: asparagine synthase (glutamine-hydrolyzing) [Thermoanaerobaculia bacterium]|nr:asparagine synthase (glutamine-hydrolyzing) [Thermoanaerobaculia bacterium]
MCGICGYTGAEEPGALARMSEALRHRGPDASGTLERGGVHLAARRLRILDLEGGDQPLFNEDGTVGVVFNGEIYNHRELRRELEAAGHRFRTRTDTEVLVHLYEEHGPEMVGRLDGMFAFALHDAPRRRLLLARDPVGIKPLVYRWDGRRLVFGSEAKALLAHPAVTARLDPDALHLLLNVRFVPAPWTLFEGIRQLPPGHLLVLEEGGEPRLAQYHRWRFPGRRRLTLDEAAEGFLEALTRAVERQLVADVPVGVFLSGGLDSSAVVAGAALDGGTAGLSSFCLGFGEPGDELADAARVAAHFGTRHRELTLAPRPLALYPRIVHFAEAPKVNAPQGYYLSRFAAGEVRVALSGLGGDELFLGYDVYRHLWPGRLLVDGPAARPAAALAGAADALAGLLARAAGPRAEVPRRALELAASGGDPLRYWATLRNGWDLGPAVARELYAPAWRRRIAVTTREAFAPFFDRPDLPLVEQVQWAELRSKMVDDFLANEDRMSMASSLEVRVPLLDREVVELAFSLPLEVKFRRRERKAVMRRALAPHLPAEVLRKPKRGFTFDPYEQVRKDLGELCRRELTPAFLAEQGIVRPEFVRRILEARPSPRRRWHYFMIWQLLGLKFWQEIFEEGRPWPEIEDRIARR